MPDAEDTPTERPEPRAMQPWSEHARQVAKQVRHRQTGRQRQLARFKDGLAAHIEREEAEDQGVASVLTLVLRMVWGPLMLGGAVVLRQVTGATEYTKGQFAVWLSASILIGVAAGQFWRRLRDVDAGDADMGADPFGAERTEQEFTRLRTRRDPDDV